TLVADEPISPVLLAKLAGSILIGATGLLGPGPSMVHQTVGIPRCRDLHEVAAAHFQIEVDVLLELGRSRQGKMTLEDDAVEAMQGADDVVCELDEEGPYCLHGILPRLVELSTN